MNILVGYSYHLKDSFFSLVNDNYLMSNKENGHYRPHFCAIQDKNDKDLYWMVPISSQVEKYKTIHDKQLKKYQKCDKIVLGKFAGKACAYLIQNAFSVTAEHIDHIHTVAGTPVLIHDSTVKEIKKKLGTCLALKKRGINLFYPDIDAIISKLK